MPADIFSGAPAPLPAKFDFCRNVPESETKPATLVRKQCVAVKAPAKQDAWALDRSSFEEAPEGAAATAAANPQRIYVAIQYRTVAAGIEFEWDDENEKHLGAHKVAPAEFEQLLNNDPLDLSFEPVDDEERYRSVGVTDAGRLLSAVWTIRNGKVRAITAFPAGVSDRKAFLERSK
jgi:hypothetical protein